MAALGKSGRLLGPGLMALLAGAILVSCSNPLVRPPRPLLHVQGTIQNRDGAGIEGARIEFGPRFSASARDPNAFAVAYTDAAGGFHLDLLEGDYEYWVGFPDGIGLDFASGFQSVTLTRSSPRVDIRLTGFFVTGSLIDPLGATVDSGLVYASSERGDFLASSVYRNGSFSFLIPSAGLYRFDAFPLGPGSGLPGVKLRAVPVAGDTTLTLQIEGQPVTGTVLGPDGLPLEGASVTLAGSHGDPSARTSADGSYRLWVAPGSHRFLAEAGASARYVFGRVSPWIDVAGPTTIDWDLAGTNWAGSVRESGSDAPVESALVSASAAPAGYPLGASAYTNSSGAFALTVEPGLDYNLEVKPPPGALWQGIRTGAVAGADTTFDFTLAPPAP